MFQWLLILSLVAFGTATQDNDSHFRPPIIDIGPLVYPLQHKEVDAIRVRQEILQASNTWGFFQVVNHGIDESFQQQLINQMHLFFNSSQNVKYTMRRTEDNSRGFADDELTKRLKDVKEIFDVGQVPYDDLTPEALKNQVLDGVNQWPSAQFEHLNQFKPTVDSYYDACLGLSRILVKVMADVLPCSNETYFTSAFDRHSSFLRLNYYPPLTDGVDAGAATASDQTLHIITSDDIGMNEMDSMDSAESELRDLPRRLGVSRHTDAGALTVLLQDPNPAIQHGLEVYSGTKEDAGDGVWVPVTPVPGALTINTGDMLQVWSNGLLKAPEHRVRPTIDPQRVRYSAPFFYNPNYDTVVTPLTTQCSTTAAATAAGAATVGAGERTTEAGTSREVGASGEAKTPMSALTQEISTGSTPTGAKLLEQIQLATTAPRYNAIRWGDYRNMRFQGDFQDVGEEVQIEHFQAL